MGGGGDVSDETKMIEVTRLSWPCGECGNPCDGISEHQFFHYGVIALRCSKCKAFGIVGGNRWIKFPKWVGDSRLMLGLRGPNTQEEADQLAAWEVAQRKAWLELAQLAKEVASANVPTVTLSEHQHFDWRLVERDG